MNSIAKPKKTLPRSLKNQRTHPYIETCQFVLDEVGRIAVCDENSADKIACPFTKLLNRSFREVLTTINPDWESLLPQHWADAPDSLFLPWSVDGEKAPSGIRLNKIAHRDSTFITLTSELAPYPERQEISIRNYPQDTLTFAQVYQQLQTTESRLHNYMHHFPGVFFSQRSDFSFNYISEGFFEITGYVPEDFLRLGSRFKEIVFEKDYEFFLQEIEKQTFKNHTFSVSYRIRNYQDDSIRYIMDVRTPVISPSGLLLGYDGVWLDITRQSIAETHLISTTWKENLAVVTGGLIHDFSNIMAGIFSLSELYFDNLPKDDPMHAGLGQIKKSSQQAQALVRRIIDLNRETSSQRNYHNLTYLLNDQLDLIKIILPKNCQVETQLLPEEIPVYIDDVAFRQLILNLAMNARDALGGQGKISITTKRIEPGELIHKEAVHGPIVAEREGIEIEFSDNGCGIESDICEHIFEPFFTTKETSKGSGFGLYNARLFVEENKGYIGVNSQIDQGTRFYIYLPIADFTEIDDDGEEETAPATSSRKSLIVYGRQDPEYNDIVAMLRNQEWEVITFCQLDKLKRHLKETALPPTLLVAINIGRDPLIESLIDTMISKYPQIRRVLQVRGENPDCIPERLRKKVERVFDESIRDLDIVKELTLLVS